MKVLACVVMFICVSGILMGYQNAVINLTNPSVLEANEAEIYLGHRFYGTVWEEPLDTFFGTNAGANVQLGYKHNIGYSAELKANYARKYNQYELGGAWRFLAPESTILAQADISYVSFAIPSMDKRRSNFRYIVSLQNAPLRNRLVCTLNAGWDGYYERFVSGVGISVLATESISLIGEYYPATNRRAASDVLAGYMGDYDAYAIGIKIDTYGHNFIFSLGNADHFEVSRLSMGTNNQNDLRFGFNIRRRMYF